MICQVCQTAKALDEKGYLPVIGGVVCCEGCLNQKQLEAFQEHREGAYLITPAFSQELLKCNRHNRRVKETRMGSYRKQMNEGVWVHNREPLIFSIKSSDNKGERLISGQHRLLAASKADKSPLMDVAFCENDNHLLLNSIDSGIPRTAADQLQTNLEGVSVKNAAVYTTVAKLGRQFDAGKFPKNTNQHDPAVYINGWVEENLDFLDKFSKHPSPKGGLLLDETNAFVLGRAALVFSAYVITSKFGFKEATQFTERLVTGANLAGNSPILLAKDFITRMKTGSNPKWKKLNSSRTSTLCKSAVICKAFSHDKLGKPMLQMRVADKDIDDILEFKK